MGQASVPEDRMRILSAGETVSLAGVRVKVLRSKTIEDADTDHFAYGFTFDAGKVWHSGDMMRGITSVPELMEPLIAERPDVVLLTMTPQEGGEFPALEEGLELARKVGATVAIPSHYGCFTQRDYDPQSFAALFAPAERTRPVIIQYCDCYIYRS
jgi:L-ascorbate metabolism protein UlaG (beta-lactamase superfamily)